ncbi:putative Ig domain-containing protein [Tahibacter soli]|uniref:Ig domain-containing protein n=1 Tax=Tahibacter soli TaxID=2983605 RepID=A0A9X4BII0_9GAMM|nr:putative Ig domain-containing protein [Tahibacter soli]MDC8014006.1 putative Ig domain-containing protein [Tahibacter soli]
MHDPGSRYSSRRVGFAARCLAIAAALLGASAAPAQVQRTFVNLGFELPDAGTSTCYFQIAENAVPGWTTNHPSQAGAACAPNIAHTTGPLIEIWANGFSGVMARHGKQFAELNAEASSRIFQNVCLANGEPIGWRFSHRGRASASVKDQAEFRIGSTGDVNQVVRAQTTNSGVGAHTCYGTAASTTGVGNNTCANAAAPNGWRDYSGQFTWNGPTGVQAIGFEAKGTASTATIGNFIDDIQVTLRPFVELTSAQASVREGANDALPQLRVVGTVPAGGIAVTLAIDGGTAARGSDYATASGTNTLSVTVPAGVYDGTNFALPLTMLDDAAIEDNETISLAITSSPTNYVLSSTRTCGAAPITATSVTVLDNDADLAVSLAAPASARAGGPLVYVATYENRTAAPTVGDTASRTIATLLAEAVPAGLTINGWTCAATGGARCPGGAPDATVGGSGAIAGAVTLPAGATVSFTVGATIAPTQCAAIGLTAQIAMPAGYTEGTSVQAGYATPAPGGSANNAATASVASVCNVAPVARAASVAVAGGGTAAIVLDASDADGDTLTYRVVTAPQHGTLSGTAPNLTYSPDAGYVGSDTFTFVANDGTVDSAAATVAITVTASNRAPTVATPPSEVPERGTYAHTLDASDPNAGDTLGFSLVRAPSGMTVGASSGALNWPADDTLVGSSRLDNALCFGGGTSVSAVPPAADIAMVVDESASMIGEHAWIADIAVPFQAYLTANGVGDGGEPNRYGLVGFTRTAATIPVGGVPFGDYRALIGATGQLYIPDGVAEEDGWRAIMHALTQYPWRTTVARNVLFVSDEDRDAVDTSLSYASVLAALASSKTMLNAVVNVRLRCGDGSAAMGLGADGTGYKHDGSGGYVTCANASAVAVPGDTSIADYVNLALATGGAAWDIEVLRDGGHYAESFTNALIALKVREILSQQPTAEQADLTVHALRVEDGQVHATLRNRGLAAVDRPFVLALSADGTTFARVTVDALAAGASVERSVDWPADLAEPARVSARIEAPGTVECRNDNNDLTAAWARVRVTDAGGLTAERAFSVAVTDVNDAPDITSTAPTTVALGDRYLYTVTATDPDRGDALEYLLDAAPDGMTIDRLTGVIRFQPTANQSGPHSVAVRVRDLAGASDTQTVTLTVGAGRAPPRFTSTPNRRAVQGEIYTYTATAAGEPDAVLRYTLVEGPAGMTMDAVSGVVTWGAPADFDDDAERIALRVNDQFGGYHLQFYTLLGDVPNEAPTITTVPPTRVLTGYGLTYTPAAIDANLFETQVWDALIVPSGVTLTNGTPPTLSWPGWASESAMPAELAVFNRYCLQTDAAVKPFQPVAAWRVAARAPGTQALIGPLSDTNDDGRLDASDRIAVVSIAAGGGDARVRALDAATGDEWWTTAQNTADATNAPAMADIDGSGEVTIVYLDTQGHVVALRADGSLRWRSSVSVASGMYYNALQLADLDRDGRAEILIGRSVFDADGALRWRFPAGATEYGRPLALDLDGDGMQEVLHRGQTRRADGTLWWSTPSLAANESMYAAYYAPIPVDGGARIGVVVSEETSAGYRLSLLRPDGTTVWRIAGGSVTRTGPPLVADFVESSPGPEIFLAATEQMYASDGRLLWTLAGTSGWRYFNGMSASAADADADGRLEIYTWADDGLNVVNPETGYVTAARIGNANFSYTGQVATFADPTGSGDARLWLGDGLGMSAYRPALGTWSIGARFVHQQAYAADRIGPDMRVPPAMPGAIPAPLYVFGAPSTAHDPTRYLPDLRVFGPYSAGSPDEVTLKADVVNRGTGASRAFAVEFHNGTPASPGNLLGRVELEALGPGKSATAILPPLPAGELGTGTLVARVVTAPEETECETRNNASSGVPMQIAVTDRDGLRTRQTWAIGYDRGTFATPTFVSTPPTAATENVPYVYTVQATSANIGDSLIYWFEAAPDGATIDPHTGVITWTPRWGFPGGTGFQVRATSLSGLSYIQTWWVTVARSTDPNTAPRITSTAPLHATVGEAYEYPVVAVDDEGHAITYTLTAAPTGMTIGAAGGAIRWTPTSATPATVTVTVKATDARDASTTQTYELRVHANANHAPTITSTPALTASPTVAYTYALTATDPDGDTLTTHWLTLPAGATGDASGIAWTPTAGQIGEHAFDVEVRDGRGGVARQTYTVFVNDATANGAPDITSTAPTAATAGQSYTYAVIATDPDNDALTYRLTTKPTGMTIAANGAIAWTPVASQVGTHAVRVEVTDGHGGGAWQAYDIVVATGGGGGTGPNAEPEFASTPPTGGKLGRAYRYDAVATDADGDTLVYSLEAAPSGMTINSATGRIDWNPAATGDYPVRVRASDGRAWVEQGWTLTVVPAGALALNLSFAPDTVNPNEPVTVHLIPTNASGQLYATLQLDGVPVTLDDLSAVVTSAAPGLHTLAASVSDGVELANASGRFLVRAPEDVTAPRVSLSAPDGDARITAPTDVRVTIADEDLVEWTLTIVDANGGTPTPISSGTTTVTDAVIGRIDPTLLLNGQYHVTLRATDAQGHRTTVVRVVLVDGDMKVGHFSITLEDASIDVAGIPVRVTRTYDTRRAKESLDFGYGWTVDYNNVRVHESRKLGFGWSLIEYRNGFFSNWCVLPNGNPIVSVTMPDGDVQRFKAKAHPECQMFIPQPDVEIVFEALPGTTSKLEQMNYGNVRIIEDRITEIGAPDTPIDASQYRLTTPDGLQWSIDQHFGARQVRDPHGNTLTFTRDGVEHSSGMAVTFVRDTAGRITTMHLPDDTERTYGYDTNGEPDVGDRHGEPDLDLRLRAAEPSALPQGHHGPSRRAREPQRIRPARPPGRADRRGRPAHGVHARDRRAHRAREEPARLRDGVPVRRQRLGADRNERAEPDDDAHVRRERQRAVGDRSAQRDDDAARTTSAATC